MTLNRFFAIGLLLALGACGQDRQPQAPSNEAAPPAPTPLPAAKGSPPPPASSLPEPNGPIDPKSVEAAGQVVQHFGALIEQQRYAEAEKYWSDAKTAAAFTGQLRPRTHLEIGDLGDTEGAAGSIYTTVPAVFYGDTFRRPASVILRRVNDVPGSTEAQRRWHIERIDWAG